VTKRPGTWLTLFPEGRSPGDGSGRLVEATEKRVVVYDVPQSILDLFEADVFLDKRRTEEVLAGV
jgi:hypothetical protein